MQNPDSTIQQSSEQSMWEGSPSQWINFGSYFAAGVLALITVGIALVIVGPWAAAIYFSTKKERYRLTTERLFTSHGLLSTVEDELELYRVKDSRLEQPFVLKLVGLANVQLFTTDRTTKQVFIRAIPADQARAVREQIRSLSEARRHKKGMREVELVSA